jgi:hypothetical protein
MISRRVSILKMVYFPKFFVQIFSFRRLDRIIFVNASVDGCTNHRGEGSNGF